MSTSRLDARFCEVMDAAPVMIWVAGTDKACVWFNKPWLTFTGRIMAQEIGQGWSDGVHRDDFERCVDVYNSRFNARKEFRMQYRLRRHDGAYRWIDDTGIPRFDGDGGFLGYIGSCTDIHEYRKMQAELLRRLLENAELNRQADSAMLTAAIAHEIDQPLAGIVAMGAAGLRWLDKEIPSIEKAKDALSGIVQAGRHAAEIIESLRGVSKQDNRTRAPLSVNTLIREVLTLAEIELQNHHVTVQTSLDETIPTVLADRIQLQQVMLNLIKNAIEAMTSIETNSRILHLKTELDASSNIVISVQDSGPGIEPENVARIFDRFFTTKPRGMGMGLAICRSIIEAHNGRLWAEAGDQGSIFRISLPCNP
jgi:PAS domain S-box-containing protein